MKLEKNNYYVASAAALIATDFTPLEKMAKISWRIIDLTHILTNIMSAPFLLLSSQIKELVLIIESTRFFCVSFPLFFRDSSGKTFFETRSIIQIAERISITFHLVLKMLFGADKLKLIQLGILGTYSLGNLTVLKWALECSILSFNFFGALFGYVTLIKTNEQLKMNDYLSTLEQPSEAKKIKWQQIKENWLFEKMKACLRIAATVSKFILIFFATTIGAINFWNPLCQIIILSLGIISDGIGLTAFYHQAYCSPHL